MNPTKNKIAIVKNSNIKYIDVKELELYIIDGWLRQGLGKSLKIRKKIYVCNDDLKLQKLIMVVDCFDFLNNNKGWRKGQFKRRNFTTRDKVFAIDMNTGKKIEVTTNEYKINTNLTSIKTMKVKVWKMNNLVFEGYLPKFFRDFAVPENPFRKALRNNLKEIVIKKVKINI